MMTGEKGRYRLSCCRDDTSSRIGCGGRVFVEASKPGNSKESTAAFVMFASDTIFHPCPRQSSVQLAKSAKHVSIAKVRTQYLNTEQSAVVDVNENEMRGMWKINSSSAELVRLLVLLLMRTNPTRACGGEEPKVAK